MHAGHKTLAVGANKLVVAKVLIGSWLAFQVPSSAAVALCVRENDEFGRVCALFRAKHQ
jgi:hypothetical protein